MAKISIIVAAAENGVIGDSVNDHLWTAKADTKHFFDKTRGHIVIVGRKTLERMGRPMPNRTNIVITRDPNYEVPGHPVVNSVEQAIELVKDKDVEVFIIGGGEIYRLALPFTDKIYLTRVHLNPKGDVVFDFDPSEWRETSKESFGPDEDNDAAYDFIEYERVTDAIG